VLLLVARFRSYMFACPIQLHACFMLSVCHAAEGLALRLPLSGLLSKCVTCIWSATCVLYTCLACIPWDHCVQLIVRPVMELHI
jgi:hypothetical protein